MALLLLAGDGKTVLVIVGALTLSFDDEIVCESELRIAFVDGTIASIGNDGFDKLIGGNVAASAVIDVSKKYS